MADFLPPQPPKALERGGGWRAWPRWWRAVIVAGGVVVIAAVIASFINLDEYAIIPGYAQNVAPLIGAPAKLTHDHTGQILLTDVDLVQLRALDYLFYRLDPNDSIVATSALTGTASISTYDEQGVIDMYTARQAATFAALKMLGYPVRASAAGAIIYQLEQPSSASGLLSVGEVITAVSGRPITTLESLAAAVGAFRPGAVISVTYHRIGATQRHTVQLHLGTAHIKGTGAAATPVCLPAGQSTSDPTETERGKALACIGIYLDNEPLYVTSGMPFSLNINPEGIIGPSAGLAFALGIIEKLDAKDLTAGMKVAATGTMAINGAVGDVGGVAQKTVAVERAGATVFFVPTQEYQVALAHATKSLKVYEVSSLSGAVKILERLGGAIAPPTRS